MSVVCFINAENGVNMSYAYDAVRFRHADEHVKCFFSIKDALSTLKCHVLFSTDKRETTKSFSVPTPVSSLHNRPTHTHDEEKIPKKIKR